MEFGLEKHLLLEFLREQPNQKIEKLENDSQKSFHFMDIWDSILAWEKIKIATRWWCSEDKQ